jgi:hypothetical protein
MLTTGKDATDAMLALHPAWVMEKIPPFYIADLNPVDIENSEISKDFRELNDKLRSIGRFVRLRNRSASCRSSETRKILLKILL